MPDSTAPRSPLTGAPDTPVLDDAVLDNLLLLAGGDPSFLDSVFSVFFQSTPEQLTTMKSLQESAEWEKLRRLSHTLRGSCSTLGAPGFVAACHKLEAACKDSDTETAGAAIGALVIEFEWIGAELAAFKNR